jgi:hypothetical protein
VFTLFAATLVKKDFKTSFTAFVLSRLFCYFDDFVKYFRWGNYVGSPAYPQPNVVWQQVQPFQVSNNFSRLCREYPTEEKD